MIFPTVSFLTTWATLFNKTPFGRRKAAKKKQETKIRNWALLYEKLHCGLRPVCEECGRWRECYKKYGNKKKKWPHITKDEYGCQSFKERPAPVVFTGAFGPSRAHGSSGKTGLTGFSGYTPLKGYNKYNGKQPPWNRGKYSCTHKCNTCPSLKGGQCTRP